MARPGGYDHIAIEVALAQCWLTEERLHSAAEFGTRALEGCDKTTATGALVKGRSSWQRIHHCCRKMGALEVAGDLYNFYFYVPSKKNYADPPSRVYRGKSLSLDRPSLGLSERWLVALHLYSGRRRDGDFENALRAAAVERCVLVICSSLDIRVSCKHDLLRNKLFSQLRFWWKSVFRLVWVSM